MNVRNSFQLIGRLTQDTKIFENKDGSKKIRFTIATKDNFATKDGQRGSQFIPVEAFRNADAVNKAGLGVYANIHKGDEVAVTGQIKNNNYTDAQGVAHYDLVLQIETIDLMEPKSITDARAAQNAVASSDGAGVSDDVVTE